MAITTVLLSSSPRKSPSIQPQTRTMMSPVPAVFSGMLHFPFGKGTRNVLLPHLSKWSHSAKSLVISALALSFRPQPRQPHTCPPARLLKSSTTISTYHFFSATGRSQTPQQRIRGEQRHSADQSPIKLYEPCSGHHRSIASFHRRLAYGFLNCMLHRSLGLYPRADAFQRIERDTGDFVTLPVQTYKEGVVAPHEIFLEPQAIMPGSAQHMPRKCVPQQQSLPAELFQLPQQAFDASRQAPTPPQPPIRQPVLHPMRDPNAPSSPGTLLHIGPSLGQLQNPQPMLSLKPIKRPQPPFPNQPVKEFRVTADTWSIEDAFTIFKQEPALPRPSSLSNNSKPAPS